MKLKRQTILHFQDGKSDKVYEVDLCEVGPEQFLVNFRYGRRGSTLREGTKTVDAVSLAEAIQIFDKLVDSKVKKGYSEAQSISQAADESVEPETTVTDDSPGSSPLNARDTAILARLQKGIGTDTNWKLSRAIWRAAELKLADAVELLEQLIGIDPMTDYSIAYALGRIGKPSSVTALEKLAEQYSKKNQSHVGNLAREAIRLAADDRKRQELIDQAMDALPTALSEPIKGNDSEKFEDKLTDGLTKKEYQPSILVELYFIDDAVTRPALINILRGIELEPPYFRQVRRIFKTSEMRRDGQVFGILAHRFEKYQCKFRMKSYYWRNEKKPTLGDSPQKAFSAQTRDYFRRRVWQTLRRLGDLADPDFVPMAVGTLLAYSDEDAKPVRQDAIWNWQDRSYTYIYWDIFASYWAFNQLLYRHSPRFVQTSKSFRVAPGLELGSEPGDENEAAFPHLWKQEPRGLVHLLLESRCRPVHQFASRALRECPEFCRDLPLDVIKELLQANYDETVNLGFDLARPRYDSNNPDLELLSILATCKLSAARDLAKKWISANRDLFFANTEFTFQLLTCSFRDTREIVLNAAELLPKQNEYTSVLVGKAIAFMQNSLPDQVEIVEDLANLLLRSTFETSISSLGEQVIIDLLRSEINEVQLFGASVVMQHRTLATSPTESVLRSMIDASNVAVRAMAIKLIGNLPAESLTKNVDMLAGLSCHELEDVRQEVRPLVRRLSDSDVQFARKMVSALVNRLLQPGAPEGVPSHTANLILEDLSRFVDHVPDSTVWALLRSRSSPAQQVGGFLLPTNIDPKGLSISDLVSLANHDILTVRQAAWKLYDDDVPRIRKTLSTAIRILDSKWDDSRQFGFRFIDEKIGDDELGPDVLISICDSVRPDVQQFGRQMITQRFAEADGPEYLLKLSEHPTQDLQLFASNFLKEYATDQLDRLQSLKPYFISLLSRVNCGRVAKDRALAFLTGEAKKDVRAAKIVAEIFERISATCAIGDKAKTIEGMTELHESFPEIPLPIEVKPVDVRSREGVS